MSISLKAIGYGLGALLGLGGILLLALGTTTNNQTQISTGWALVAIAVVMWFISLVSRKI